MACIHTLNVGQVVVDKVAYERTTNKALLTELCHVWCFAGNRGRVCHSFIAVHKRRIVVISNAGQNIWGIGFQIAGNILSDIQIAVIFQPLHIEAGIFQRPKNSIVVHFFRDCSHVGSHHGSALHFFGEKVVYRHTIRVGMFGIVTLDGLG